MSHLASLLKMLVSRGQCIIHTPFPGKFNYAWQVSESHFYCCLYIYAINPSHCERCPIFAILFDVAVQCQRGLAREIPVLPVTK
jgi:hypothetical protein